MTEVNPIMVQTLAKMTGKTEEEVLKFLEKNPEVASTTNVVKTETNVVVPQNISTKEVTQPKIDSSKGVDLRQSEKRIPEPKIVQDEVITEEVPLDQVTPEQLEEADENQFASTSIRVGSKVRCTWQPNVGKGKIKWVGKTGTVIQKLSDLGVSIYLVEFPAGKIPFSRLNKKTGKLERGYHTKKLQQWMDENNIEEVF